MIENTIKSLRAKGYKVSDTFVQDEPLESTRPASFRVVVNGEPMSYPQLRLLDAGRLTFEEIAAQNALGSARLATTGGGALDGAADRFRTEPNTK